MQRYTNRQFELIIGGGTCTKQKITIQLYKITMQWYRRRGVLIQTLANRFSNVASTNEETNERSQLNSAKLHGP